MGEIGGFGGFFGESGEDGLSNPLPLHKKSLF
jgi:hypothetical protein